MCLLYLDKITPTIRIYKCLARFLRAQPEFGHSFLVLKAGNFSRTALSQTKTYEERPNNNPATSPHLTNYHNAAHQGSVAVSQIFTRVSPDPLTMRSPFGEKATDHTPPECSVGACTCLPPTLILDHFQGKTCGE